MSIDGTVSASFQINDRRSVGIGANANIPCNAQASATFADGAGALQANVLYQANLALIAGAKSLDLNGVLEDSYGSTVSLLRVKGLYVKNTGVTDLTFGAGTTPMTTLLNSTGTITLPPGAACVFMTPDATGWAVTASTADLLNFTGTGTGTFSVAVLGAAS